MDKGESSSNIFYTNSINNQTLTEDIIFNFDVSEDELESGDLDELGESCHNITSELTENNNFEKVFGRLLQSAEEPINDEVSEPNEFLNVVSQTPSHVIISQAADGDSGTCRPSSSNNDCKKPNSNYDNISNNDGQKRVTQAQMYRNIVWKKKSLDLSDEEIKFTGHSILPPELLDLSTPFQFFSYFFTDDLLNTIVEETLRYSISINPDKPFNVSKTDIHRYMGILIITTVMTASNIRMYWNPKFGLTLIQNTMSVNHFEKIRQHLHFNNNAKLIPQNQPGHDKLFKIRPVIDTLVKQFSSIPLEERLAVDEQMCASKGRHHLRQYMPDKPHKYGYKFFILCGMSGYAYNFEIYTGTENNPAEKDLGASSNTVVRLTRIVPENKNHKLFFDNYYTSLRLMTYLKTKGILCLGTVRSDRIPNSKLPNLKTVKEINSVPRGTIYEYVANVDDSEVSSLMWVDNKCVRLMSTYAGTNPISSVPRYRRASKESEMIPCPNVVLQYNRHMGGVDLMDSLLGRYKIKMRSRKWYLRIFYHLVDLSVINAWLLYLRVMKEKGDDGKTTKLKLAEFRLELGETMCRMGKYEKTKRGRPSLTPSPVGPVKKKKSLAVSAVPQDVRYDQLSHWIVHTDRSCKQRCKMTGWKGFSVFECNKCKVALCVNKKNNCFYLYHNKQ